MMTTAEPNARIPVICADPSTVVGAEIFDPNSWSTNSKALVQSCWTEYSVLNHCVEQLNTMCSEAERICKAQTATLQQQWDTANFDLGKVVIFATQPIYIYGSRYTDQGVFLWREIVAGYVSPTSSE